MKYRKAQSATELAIFGAVLMFVLGIMVRQAHNANLSQGQAYRAMRLALTKSYLSSLAGRPDRNSATVLIVEDRLSPGSEKYGPISRFPMLISGSGTMTRELMMPQDFNQDSELGRIDLYINGVFFPLTIADYGSMSGLNNAASSPDWDPQCAYRYIFNAASGSSDILQWIGCTRFYRIVPNFVVDETKNLFCCDDQPSCYTSANGTIPVIDCSSASNRCCNVTNLNVARRFDLNRDPGNNPPEETALLADVTLRANFAWQWYLVKGFDPARSQDEDTIYNGTNWINVSAPYQINYGDALVFYSDPEDAAKNKNTVLDLDEDFFEEVTLGVGYNNSGIVTNINYVDYQLGDIDSTYNKLSPGPEPGLKDDVQMYSFTNDGTYLLQREGKLYSPSTQQFVRNVQKRDRVDVVQRIIQLSNNTSRFCDAGSGARIADATFAAAESTPGLKNPVEVCSDNCFSPANVDKTCYNIVDDVIYVRSRIRDLGGRKWITTVP